MGKLQGGMLMRVEIREGQSNQAERAWATRPGLRGRKKTV
jgi:hypothetical protein